MNKKIISCPSIQRKGFLYFQPSLQKDRDPSINQPTTQERDNDKLNLAKKFEGYLGSRHTVRLEVDLLWRKEQVWSREMQTKVCR